MRAYLRSVAALVSAGLVLGGSAVAQAQYPVREMGRPTTHNAGKPIWGTLENLPGMGSTELTYVGPTLAPSVEVYYSASGKRGADMAEMGEKAITLLRALLHSECGGRPVSCKAMVVFDIDETLFNNYTYWSRQSPPFSLDYDTWNTYVEDCAASVNPTIAKFYRQAKDMGVKLAIITGRTDSQRKETAQCLKAKGITGWKAFVTKPNDSSQTASVYKAQARKALEREGFTILVSIGDQISDMAGGHLRGGIWLPNPIYYIP